MTVNGLHEGVAGAPAPAGGRSRIPPPALLALAALAAAAWSFAAFSAAARADAFPVALAVVLALPLLVVLAWRPPVLIAALAAALVANAGLVLNEQFGLPSVVRGLTVLGLIVCLASAPLRSRLLRPGPLVGVLVVYAIARLGAALIAPASVDIAGIAREMAFGVAIVALLGLAATRTTWATAVAAATAGAAAVLSLVAIARQAGWLEQAYGFAEYPGLSPAQEQIVQRSLEPIDMTSRIGGPIGDPNFWAQMLVFAAPVALWFALRWSGWSRIAGVAGLVAILAGIVASGSRGGLIALAAAALVLAAASGPRGRRLALLVPVALVGAVFATGQGERFAQVAAVTDPVAAEDEAVRGRASENIAAFQMFADHPVTGVGAGNYGERYPAYAPAIGLDSRVGPREPHSAYLEAAAESGIAAALALIALFGIAIWAPLRNAGRLVSRGREREAWLARAVAAGFAGYAAAALFLHQGFPEYTWLALGLAAMAAGLGGSVPARATGGDR
jgi:hypothetical protein